MSTEYDDEPIDPDLAAFLDEDGDTAAASRSLLRQPVTAPAALMESHLAAAMAEFDRLHATVAVAEPVSGRSRVSRWQRWLLPAFGLAAAAGLAVAVVTQSSSDRDGFDAAASSAAPTIQEAETKMASTGAAIDSLPALESPPGVQLNPSDTVTADVPPEGGAGFAELNDPNIQSADHLQAEAVPNLTSNDALKSFVRSRFNARAVTAMAIPCPEMPGEALGAIGWYGQPALVYLTAAADGLETATVVDSACTIIASVVFTEP